jgi:hypothetical protein
MSIGLRIGDASSLRVDCIVRDGQGAPYLHYTNHKMAGEAFVPIDTDLAEAITAQQQAVLKSSPNRNTCCRVPPAIRKENCPSAPPPSAASYGNGCATAIFATSMAAQSTSRRTNGAIPSEPG